MDLQYLPEDKKREDDPDIRKMLLETLILVRTASQIFHLFYLSFACIEVNDLHNHSNVWGDTIFFFTFLKVSYVHQGCIYMIKNTVSLWNIVLFEYFKM